eukprot:scaffold8274_cov164-Chaetoceros_neogracile.AAC.1
MDRAMVVVVVPMLMWEVLVCGRNVWGAKALDVFASRIRSRLAAAMEAMLSGSFDRLTYFKSQLR